MKGVLAGDQEVSVPMDEGTFWVKELSKPRIDSGVGNMAYGDGVSIARTFVSVLVAGV